MTNQPNHQPLAEKVLEQIEEQHVAPRPRWVFVVRNLAFWGLWILSLLIGAAAMAAALFVFTNAGWEFREVTQPQFVSFLLENIPILWIVALVLMLVLGIENLRQTKAGYRYPMLALLGLNLLGSAVLGYGLFRLGAGQFVDQEVGGRIPFHRPVLVIQERAWTHPEQGLLSGAVTAIQSDQSHFTVRTFDGDEWIVSADDVSDKGRNVLVHVPFVRVVGVPVVEDATGTVFHACFVFPWEINGGRFPAPPKRPSSTFEMKAPGQNASFPEDSPCAALQMAPRLRVLEHAP
jgi:hypothetical protein